MNHRTTRLPSRFLAPLVIHRQSFALTSHSLAPLTKTSRGRTSGAPSRAVWLVSIGQFVQLGGALEKRVRG